ncbi:MAG TPA: hypothetical protein VJM32_06700 [Candidatus Saccharimonadales bacterium]|nr:hypothetical protein [Candidatus Saccharimonadales bacterium]
MSADRTSASSSGNQGEDTQISYDIRAPVGGLRDAVQALIGNDARRFIDLAISSGPGHRAEVRVYPHADMLHPDSTREDLFHIFGATCYPLVDGKETGPGISCSGYVNTQVTIAPLETGKLRLLFTEGDPL